MLDELSNGEVQILYEVFLAGETQHYAPAFRRALEDAKARRFMWARSRCSARRKRSAPGSPGVVASTSSRNFVRNPARAFAVISRESYFACRA
jgi:hypothetical protein